LNSSAPVAIFRPFADVDKKDLGGGEVPQAIVDYHYGLDAERYAFFRIPKIIMTEPYFDTMSTDAKMLYGLMLDRLSLSRENGWVDEDERVYIYFTIEDVCDTLHCKADKAVKLLAELDLVKGFGLIQRIKQGQGKPARIYVLRYLGVDEAQTSVNAKSRLRNKRSLDYGKTEVCTTEKPKSRLLEIRGQDYGKTEANNNKKNNTDFNVRTKVNSRFIVRFFIVHLLSNHNISCNKKRISWNLTVPTYALAEEAFSLILQYWKEGASCVQHQWCCPIF